MPATLPPQLVSTLSQQTDKTPITGSPYHPSPPRPAPNAMDSPLRARTPTLTHLTTSLSAVAIARLRKFKALQIQSLLFSSLNHPSYHKDVFRGLVNVNTPSQTTRALLVASPHLPDEEKRTVIEPLRRAIGQMDDGSARQGVTSDDEVHELSMHEDRFMGSVGPGCTAEWVTGVTDETATDCGHESAEQSVREVNRMGGQVRRVIGATSEYRDMTMCVHS